MGDPHSPELAKLTYQLADELIRLRYYAAATWVSGEEDDLVPEVVATCVSKVGEITTKLANQLNMAMLSRILTTVHQTAVYAEHQYRDGWAKDERQIAVRVIRNVQELPEKIYDVTENLLLSSPIGKGAWRELEDLTWKLGKALPPPLAEVFQLGTTLAENQSFIEPYVSFPKISSQSEKERLRVDLANKVKSLVHPLLGSFPSLKELNFDLSKPQTVWKLRNRIDKLHAATLSRMDIHPSHPGLPIGNAGEKVPASSPLAPEERERLIKLKKDIDPDNTYVGESDAILRVFKRIEELNRHPFKPVLILGQSGVGKTEIAQLIHKHSKRTQFYQEQAADSAASDTLIVRGRWMGYGANSGLHNIPLVGLPGLLQQYAGGTIFMDEFAQLSREVQGMFRTILDGRLLPYAAGGSGQGFQPNVRFIFATNVDPARAVQEGTLLHDLWSRLEKFQLFIPPLSVRKEDILLKASGEETWVTLGSGVASKCEVQWLAGRCWLAQTSGSRLVTSAGFTASCVSTSVRYSQGFNS